MNMRVDVVIITKNSERMLNECLKAVYENVPLNRLIVVDGYSIDRTLEIVRGFQKKHGNVLVIPVIIIIRFFIRDLNTI